MKRMVILGLAALLALGVGLSVVADDAILTIGEDCVVAGSTGSFTFPAAASDPADAGDHDSAAVTWTGFANFDASLCVEISGPLTTNGYELATSLKVTYGGITQTIDPVTAAARKIQVDTIWGNGTWSLDVVVDVHRNGYADHAGTYTATVTVTCGPCV